MPDREPIPFEIEVNDTTYSLLGNCAILLFREQPELSHVRIDADGKTVRGFNNIDLCYFMAGYLLRRDEEGHWVRPTVVNGDNNTFETEYGWSPTVGEFPEASEDIKQAFAEVAMSELDDEWGSFDA
jgi:hypothetical protein